MVSKYLEKRVEIIPDGDMGNTGVPLELEYYLVESDVDMTEDIPEEKTYGIEIVKKTENRNIENEMIRNLCYNKGCAMDILNKLVYNTVTPVELPFVIDDLLGV